MTLMLPGSGFLYEQYRCWSECWAKFDGYNVGGTLQTFTDLDHIDPIWRSSSLSPAFRIRVKKPDGTYRTTVIDGETNQCSGRVKSTRLIR